MMGYLQRLAQRAEGVSLTPSIIPARYNLTTKEQTPDPFATSETVAPDVSPAGTPAIISKTLEEPDVREDQYSPMFPGRRRIKRAEPNVMKEPSEPTEIRSLSEKAPAMIERPPSRSEVSSSALNETEFREIHQILKKEPGITTASTQLSRRDVSEPVGTQRPLEEALPFDVRPRLAATSKLEPPRADVFSDEPLPPDEPRLVIGQLRVDVVPSTPTQPREVVRTVTRTVGPSQIKRPGLPTSRLRFGLGQM